MMARSMNGLVSTSLNKGYPVKKQILINFNIVAVQACLQVAEAAFLPPSVRREVKRLSELLCLLLQQFSDILIFWKIFNVNKAQILTFSALLSNVSI